MQSRKVNLYYFSGTGNTFLVMNEIKKYFENAKVPVKSLRIEKHKDPIIEEKTAIGIIVPIAFQSTFPFLWKFINDFPKGNNEIFLVTTMGAFSGGLLGPAKKIFSKKGYKPIGAKEIIMPSNFRKKSQKPDKLRKKIDKGLEKARIFAHDIHLGFTKWKSVPVLPSLMKKLVESEKVWKTVRSRYKLSVISSKCIRCGICFKLCPIDNLIMNEYPEILGKCELCMRCYSFCPTNAIEFENSEKIKYQAVPVEEILK